ncbi:hypothetical protein [Leptolyngbya sp. O-77]|uniref:hypothetical protein n=1 Tax=Leptolyngbya sp. O-77 TaxID=1080068 RepID=UPI00074D450D|nr:hypothetical protein [Leptolyngbya sp. O-77]BAU43452.1 hypothetical protein O77CONTIG1_03281 [Leptolyngbya sp. O-77]
MRQRYAGRIRYWCSDESRVGLLTVQHRKLTGFGVQPIGSIQWEFVYRWLYGLVEPLSGASWRVECSHLDSSCFEAFLHSFAAQFPDDLHLIQVNRSPYSFEPDDTGQCHFGVSAALLP